MSSGIAYWPGDLNPAQFQTLQYSPSTNTLTLSPFGNSVVITPTSESFSTINVSTISVNVTNASTINSIIQNTSTLSASTIISQQGSVSSLNVSSINGVVPSFPQPVQSWINPGSPINVSTISNAPTFVPAAAFSTIAGHSYLVGFEYGASNLGGGNATDQTNVSIIPTGGGHITIADSWITDQTYSNRYAAPSAYIVASSTDAQIGVANDTSLGNVQNVNFFRLYTQDLGIPQNKY